YSYMYGSGKGDMLSETFPDNSSHLYQYEQTYHKLTQATDSLGRTTQYAYNTTSDLTTVTDALSQVTTMVWSSGLLQSKTDPLNHANTYQSDTPTRRLPVAIDAAAGRTTATYDTAGNPTTVKDALARTTTTQYDGLRRPTAVTDAAGSLATMAYNAT